MYGRFSFKELLSPTLSSQDKFVSKIFYFLLLSNSRQIKQLSETMAAVSSFLLLFLTFDHDKWLR